MTGRYKVPLGLAEYIFHIYNHLMFTPPKLTSTQKYNTLFKMTIFLRTPSLQIVKYTVQFFGKNK